MGDEKKSFNPWTNGSMSRFSAHHFSTGKDWLIRNEISEQNQSDLTQKVGRRVSRCKHQQTGYLQNTFQLDSWILGYPDRCLPMYWKPNHIMNLFTVDKWLNLFVHTILPFANHALLRCESQSLVFQFDVPFWKRFCWMNTASLPSNDRLILHVVVDGSYENCFTLGGVSCFFLLKLHHHAPSLSYKNQTSIQIISKMTSSWDYQSLKTPTTKTPFWVISNHSCCLLAPIHLDPNQVTPTTRLCQAVSCMAMQQKLPALRTCSTCDELGVSATGETTVDSWDIFGTPVFILRFN